MLLRLLLLLLWNRLLMWNMLLLWNMLMLLLTRMLLDLVKRLLLLLREWF